MNNIKILIPSLDPDGKLLGVVKELVASTDFDLILLDDGSGKEGRNIFDELEKNDRCTILRHAINLGKGRALKDGFNYILNTYPQCLGVVTVDGDGQHLTKDIVLCAKALYDHPKSLVLGSRDFDGKDVPTKSSFGNKVTRQTMKLLCGVNIPDTQTGLRGISADFMKLLMTVPGERFEFETNMLLCAKENNIPFEIVTIDTVYLEGNATTHFNPLKDSFKIYSIFIKFLVSSSSSFLIDVTLFTILATFLRDIAPLYYIFVSTAVARVVSAVFNYNLNKKTVFKNFEHNPLIVVKYILLCIVQLCLSAFFVEKLYYLLRINESIVKIMIDMILFFISFTIQREWVFRSKNNQ
ncbi:MAG: bifunctional glycosyltransferase family 2/GtrA family protein [Oscillospiraceae bacterium]